MAVEVQKFKQRLTTTPRDVNIVVVKNDGEVYSTVTVLNQSGTVHKLNVQNSKLLTKQLDRAGFDTDILAPSTIEEIRQLYITNIK